jgi:hypothetical protein
MEIKNYNEIEVLNNSLVIFDLDETIIHFPYITRKWWENTKNAYSLINEKTADLRAYSDWLHIITTHNPSILDVNEFNHLLKRIKDTNSTFIIVTARNIKLMDITKKHLECFGISCDVFYTIDKGIMINAIKQNYVYNHILFVDDNLKYINQVEELNQEIVTYYMKHENLI